MVQNLPNNIRTSWTSKENSHLGMIQARALDYHALKRARVYNIVKSTIYRLEWPTYLISQAILSYDKLVKSVNGGKHVANDRIMAFLAIYHAAKVQGIIINVSRLLEDGGINPEKFRRAMLRYSPAKYVKRECAECERNSSERSILANALAIAKELTDDASVEHAVLQVYSRLKRELVSFKERTIVGIIAYLSVLRVSKTAANLNKVAARVGYPLSTLYTSICRLYKKVTRDRIYHETPSTEKLFKKVQELDWVFPKMI